MPLKKIRHFPSPKNARVALCGAKIYDSSILTQYEVSLCRKCQIELGKVPKKI